MSIRVYGLKQPIWILIFLAIFSFSFVLMGGTLASKSWVYTTAPYYFYVKTYNDWHNNRINFGVFEGNLYRCTESCNETYKKLSTEYCDRADELYIDYPEDYFICKMFKNLNKAMILYLICECFAMFCMFFVALFLIFSRKSLKIIILYIIYALLTMLIVAHHIGFISWMSVTNTNFNRNCVDIPNSPSENIDFCAGDGPALALFTSILLPLISVLFCFVSRRFRVKVIKIAIKSETKPEKQ